MENLKLFIQLTRLNKPIGYMLLFWPCLWGLTIAYDFKTNLNNYFFYLILFFIGSVLMRSAGCIVNDILDKELIKEGKNNFIIKGIFKNSKNIKKEVYYYQNNFLLELQFHRKQENQKVHNYLSYI